MTMQEMVTNYNRLSAAHKYILGFVNAGRVFYSVLSFAELALYFKLDRASSKRGGFAKIRIKLTADQRHELLTSGRALEIADESELEADPKYNKGENFERIVTEKLAGEVWAKDKVPFNVAGDVRLGGEEIQVKLDNAELTNEKFLGRLLAEVA